MIWWLRRYRLTPDQVASLPLRDRIRIPLVTQVLDEVEEAEQQAALRRAH